MYAGFFDRARTIIGTFPSGEKRESLIVLQATVRDVGSSAAADPVSKRPNKYGGGLG